MLNLILYSVLIALYNYSGRVQGLVSFDSVRFCVLNSLCSYSANLQGLGKIRLRVALQTCQHQCDRPYHQAKGWLQMLTNTFTG